MPKTTRTTGGETPTRAETVVVYLLLNSDGTWQVGKSIEDVTLRWEETGTYGESSYATPVKVVKVRVPVARPRVEEVDLTAPAARPGPPDPTFPCGMIDATPGISPGFSVLGDYRGIGTVLPFSVVFRCCKCVYLRGEVGR